MKSDMKSDIESELIREGHSFSFFQAIRLLRFFSGSTGSQQSAVGSRQAAGNIRIKPELSLSFPPADISKIRERDHRDDMDEQQEKKHFQITATHLGLYGTSSPLPLFYTEDFIDEDAEDESVSRDFTDVINHRLFMLLHECWLKYRQFFQVAEEKNPPYQERLFSLLGLGEKVLRDNIPDPYSLIRYTGLFTQYPKSALGLKTLLKDALKDIPVEIVSCVMQKAKIPEDQRFVMGGSIGSLGKDTLVGEEIEDRMGKFRISIGPLDKEDFQKFLPGTEYYNKLVFLTKLYILEPLVYELEVILAKNQAETPCLGVPEWSRLGMNTWSFSGKELDEQRVTFYPT